MPDRFPANGSHEVLVVLEHADVEGLLGLVQGASDMLRGWMVMLPLPSQPCPG